MIEFVDVNPDADDKIEGAELNLVSRLSADEKSSSSSSSVAAADNCKVTG